MPSFYVASPLARVAWNVAHDRGVFEIVADPQDAVGSALHVSGLSRGEMEALRDHIAQALQDADLACNCDTPITCADLGKCRRFPEARLDSAVADTRARAKAGVPPRDCPGCEV